MWYHALLVKELADRRNFGFLQLPLPLFVKLALDTSQRLFESTGCDAVQQCHDVRNNVCHIGSRKERAEVIGSQSGRVQFSATDFDGWVGFKIKNPHGIVSGQLRPGGSLDQIDVKVIWCMSREQIETTCLEGSKDL